ncbi:MAG: inorganic phosphate transporter [Candidatus Aureabacteria bacterium]|nr:inorganic phosphate transporter [Candidatus Auribacterota bacterium]
MILFAKLLGGLFLGWGIGANNSADIFGTAVATNSIRYKTAIILIAIFVALGAIVEGPKLYHSYRFSTTITMTLAFVATMSAAVTICVCTYMSLPASASQAAVGGVMGIAIWANGMGGADWGKLGVWGCCWVLSPLASACIAFMFMKFVGPLIQRHIKNVEFLNSIYKIGFIIIGCYAAYTLGGNNVVVTTGPFYQAGLFGDPSHYWPAVIAAAFGAVSISAGALTYARKVMRTVGHGITALDPFSALVVVLSHAIAIHLSTQFHIPVSSAQATVGAVAGVGFSKGMRTVNSRMLATIFCGWVLTPAVSAFLALGIAYIIGVR